MPERHLKKSDPTGGHCLIAPNCCNVDSPAHAKCYRAQCFKTVAAFVKQAGVPAGKYSVSFQSRLGRDPWLKPYTDRNPGRIAQTRGKKAPRHLPGVCLRLSGDAGGNGHSRARDVFVGKREGDGEDSVLERTSALDHGAGKHGPAVFDLNWRLTFPTRKRRRTGPIAISPCDAAPAKVAVSLAARRH